MPLDGSGFLVPRNSELLMTACSWASSKFAHLGSDGTRREQRDEGPELVREQAAGVRGIHGRHHRGIENVDVEVDPEAGQRTAIHDLEDLRGDPLRAALSDLRCGERQRERVRDLVEMLVVGSAARVDRVLPAKIGTSAVDACAFSHDGRPVATATVSIWRPCAYNLLF